MEVDKTRFYPLFLDILTDISESHFVAFDLELSGVPSKGANATKGPGQSSLQERYRETKEAAERYQILQIGITCVEEDVENKKYILKPYNFELSPLIDERSLDIERIFSFQSGAVEFLLRTGFDFSVPFEHGVPYLSRAESKEARERQAKRQDKSTIPDVQIKPTDTAALAFLDRLRKEINAWKASKAFDTPEYLNISGVNADHLTEDEIPPELTRFEKRLVHQLVRAEHPELVTISKRGFVQIIHLDQEREDRIAAERRTQMHERIGRQKGFRWVIEALLGSDISNFDLRECAKDPNTGEAIFVDMDAFKAQFFRAHDIIRGNPRILVGHNCFLDLVYIYRTFIDDLPDTVEEFAERLHKLWPTIIDTKYMSTHNCSDINPASALDQVASQLSAQQTPVLEIDAEHMKYSAAEALHEAGYDSFLTAQIATRLSPKLEKTGSYVDPSNITKQPDIADEVVALKLTDTALATHTYRAEHGSFAPTEVDGFMPSVQGARWKRVGDQTLPPQTADDPFKYDPKNRKHRYRVEESQGFEGGMPRFSSDFWRVYGNKLRVFGTEEGVCLLNPSVEDVESVEDVGVGQGGVTVEERSGSCNVM